MKDLFSDIRPFDDTEVEKVIERILANKEFVLAIAHLKFPTFAERFQSLLLPIIRWYLRRQLRGVNTVYRFQEKIKSYVDTMVSSSMSSLSFEGLEHLSSDQSYLFIGNHRDITLDPAMVNYALHMHGFDTVRIAIGDNLLTKDYVSDLMRINKSFIVRRSIDAPRKLLAALRELSTYISHSLKEDHQSIWIAQREGRAKDGLDRTDPAIIKMLALSERKKPFAEVIRDLNIVPVAVSYEYDPCDVQKAVELHQIDQGEVYQKGEHEDIESIVKGIQGFKGRVCLRFGKPLSGGFGTVEQVVAHLDQSMLALYKIPPSHFFAYEELFGSLPENTKMLDAYLLTEKELEKERAAFQAHLAAIPEKYRSYILHGYANPLLEKLNNKEDKVGQVSNA